MNEAIRRLFAHLKWADSVVLDSLREGGAASPRALELYAHVLGLHRVRPRRARRPA